MWMDQATRVGELILVLVGVLTAMIAAIRKVYKTARWIEDVHKQVHTNGGSTLRDAVVRIEGKLDGFGERIKRLEEGRPAVAA